MLHKCVRGCLCIWNMPHKIDRSLVACDIPKLQGHTTMSTSERKPSNDTTHTITCEDQKLVLASKLGFSRIRAPHDVFLHTAVSETPRYCQNAIHAPTHDKSTSVGDTFRLLLIASLVIISEAYCAARTAEYPARVTSVRSIQHAPRIGRRINRVGVDLRRRWRGGGCQCRGVGG